MLKKTIYIDGLGGESVVHQIEKGDTAPTDENILLWIDTTSDNSVDTLLSDALILEFKRTIADLNSQIADLKARVLYLEQNYGGGTVIIDSQYIMLEDGTQLMLEDGNYLLLESYKGGTTPMSYTITTKDGDTIVTKDGDTIVTK